MLKNKISARFLGRGEGGWGLKEESREKITY